MRHPVEPAKENQMRAGIQFKSLESNIDGRQTVAQLTRIVGELQREEIRRYRLARLRLLERRERHVERAHAVGIG